MKLKRGITIRQRHVFFAAILVAVSLIAAPWVVEVVEAACSSSCVYYLDANGREQMLCQQIGKGSNCDSLRWDCRGSSGCNPCGACHDKAKSNTYTDKTLTVHKLSFPKYQVLLKPGAKIPWGDGGALLAEKDGTLTEIDKAGRPLLMFPAGSMILKGTSGRPEIIYLSGEPIALKGK